uniref:Thiol:disulfide interchange protein n=1 Tax=Dicranema revolutum TaxID=239144 RepID=A0A4D6WR84_9FLOR|nr:Thiol:disulfide interchange protein [Dicranema revolutum]
MISKYLHLLEIQSYYLQQKTYIFLSSSLSTINIISLASLIIGGFITSINPCLISILPLTLTKINKSIHNNRKKNSLIYGLLSSTILMIIFTILFSNYYNKLTQNIPLFKSLLTIILGLNLLQVLELNITYFNTNNWNKFQSQYSELLINWIIGFTIGISSLSCSTPILATIVIWLSASNNLLLGALYIVCYLIGYLLPILILIYITTDYNKLNQLTQIWNHVVPASGFLVLGIGFFSLLEHIII